MGKAEIARMVSRQRCLAVNPLFANREEMAEKYHRLILKIAWKLIHSGVNVELEELLQRGYLALFEAQENFRKKKGQFSTFLWSYVEGLMRGEKVKGFTVSLNDEVIIKDEKSEMLDFIPDRSKSPEDEVFSIEIASAIKALPVKEREVMRLRYLDGMTLAEAGKVMHFSKERARQIESKAIDRLRKRLNNCCLPEMRLAA